jgi:hypothetical protein
LPGDAKIPLVTFSIMVQEADGKYPEPSTADWVRSLLRLDACPAWMRRLRNPPPAAPVDPACFAISDDMAALLKALPLRTDP